MQQLRALKQRYQDSGFKNAALFLAKKGQPSDRALRCLIPIENLPEPLQCLREPLHLRSPHPYRVLGAPYGDTEPYALRQTVVTRLLQAQASLGHLHRGYCLQIFDAYRPLAVQAFMIEHETGQLATRRGQVWDTLEPSTREALRNEVRHFWAPPNHDPTQPPPHSTGAALDLTILDAHARPLPMGTPIDHVGPESYPHFFAEASTPETRTFHRNRELLNKVMHAAGFRRLPFEWWHFSYGDQWWALLESLERDAFEPMARYGRFDGATPIGMGVCAWPKTDT